MSNSIAPKGTCVDIRDDYHVNYTMVFKRGTCYTCIKFMVRTVNVLEKIETSCISLPEERATVENICNALDPNQQLRTLFSENYIPVNCRSSLEVKSEIVQPGCRLPQNFSGEWINTANIDADIFINETHIIETWYPDEGRYRKTIYVCREQRATRFMMARLTVDGCQKDFICFDFVPQHHNIIRYRRGIAVIKDDFSTVCSWVQFQNKAKWKYDLYLKKNPVPVKCPVAGKFNFTQQGDVKFETRILGGVTLSPRPNTYCKQNISDFSVCDIEQKEIAIDENYCLSVDHLGRPVDIYSDPDYKMKCVGFWKENLKSYLITYDELDPLSKYKCWVYQRADLNRVLMSQAIGPFCDLKQDVYSWNYTEGATVAIEMQEYERERDQCPMHFDDGSNPWLNNENEIQIFDFGYFYSSGRAVSFNSILLLCVIQVYLFC
ncbi:unnamed protein product [Acanthoscelides obtectus]|uniref:Uncharacterized protein n=1 Tax=Acanthoscelides obtectus TaxID=200917 RepID=A0A9P0KXZ9_ACAOB|nr:unnamed protein product [Acanthoscelides obtectus]CAK1651221.1 hypothetical protein AOBTE_LOCUS17123 [Acanthoscelides obtectus]